MNFNDPSTLRSISALVQWVAIIFVFLGGCLQVLRHIIDLREKQVSSFLAVSKDNAQRQRETELNDKLETSRKLVADLENRIVSATAVVEATLSWDALGNSIDWGSQETGNRSYIAFGHGSEALLIVRSQAIVAKSTVKGIVTYYATYDLNAANSEVNAPLRRLAQAEFMQIGFPDIPEGTRILSGNVKMTINGNKKVVVPIDSQPIAGHESISRSMETLRAL